MAVGLGSGAFVALYLPACEGEDPTRAFESEEQALEYAYSQMCPECRRERALALGLEQPREGELAGFGVEGPDELPSCAWEWDVMPRAEYEALGEGVPAAA